MSAALPVAGSSQHERYGHGELPGRAVAAEIAVKHCVTGTVSCHDKLAISNVDSRWLQPWAPNASTGNQIMCAVLTRH